MKHQRKSMWLISICMLLAFGNCSKSISNSSGGGTPTTPSNDVEMWLTKPDQSVLLQKQAAVLSFVSTALA